jgi:uracil-DNA glycosylase
MTGVVSVVIVAFVLERKSRKNKMSKITWCTIKFSHGVKFTHEEFIVICSYNPSRQNTQTGRLTWKQWSSVFSDARDILS